MRYRTPLSVFLVAIIVRYITFYTPDRILQNPHSSPLIHYDTRFRNLPQNQAPRLFAYPRKSISHLGPWSSQGDPKKRIWLIHRHHRSGQTWRSFLAKLGNRRPFHIFSNPFRYDHSSQQFLHRHAPLLRLRQDYPERFLAKCQHEFGDG